LICNLLSTFRDNLSVPSSRSSSPLKQYKWTASHLKTGLIVCPKTLITNTNLHCVKFQKSEVSFTPWQKPEITMCMYIHIYIYIHTHTHTRAHYWVLCCTGWFQTTPAYPTSFSPSKYYPLMYVYVLWGYLFSLNPLNKIFHIFLLSPMNTTADTYTRGIMLDPEKLL